MVLLTSALKNLAHLYLENSIFEQKNSQDAKNGGKQIEYHPVVSAI